MSLPDVEKINPLNSAHFVDCSDNFPNLSIVQIDSLDRALESGLGRALESWRDRSIGEFAANR